MESPSFLNEPADLGPTHLVVKRHEPDFEERGTEAQLAALYGALASARGEFGEIRRSAEVKIEGKVSYKFRYAPMEELLAATAPALSKYGIIVMQPFVRTMEDVSKQLVILAHKDGGRLVFSFPFHASDDIKIFGGQTTYYQRYMYRSVLTLAADGDMDEMPDQARGETSATSSQRPSKPTQAPARNPGTKPSEVGATGQINKPAVAEQRDIPVGNRNGAGKASPQQVDDLKAAARACGYMTFRDLSTRLYGILWQGEVRSLGEPFLFGLTGEEAEKATEALTNERAEKNAAKNKEST